MVYTLDKSFKIVPDVLDQPDPNDDFTGANGDPANPFRWLVNTRDNTDVVEIENNQLKMYGDGSLPFGNMAVDATYSLTGDFDFQIYYDRIIVPSPNSLISLQAIFGTSSGYIRRARTNSVEHYTGRCNINGTNQPFHEVSTTDEQGYLRVRRIGTTFEGLYSGDGTSWTQLWTHTTTPGDDVDRAFFTMYCAEYQETQVNVDNFILNTGTVVWSDITNIQLPLYIEGISGSGINDYDASALFEDLSPGGSNKKIKIEVNEVETTVEIPPNSWDWGNESAMVLVDVPALNDTTEIILYYDSAESDNPNVTDVDPLPDPPTGSYDLSVYNLALADELWIWDAGGSATLIVQLDQYYSLSMLLTFAQYYGDSPEFFVPLDQYYWDSYVLIRELSQAYSGAEELFLGLEQTWQGPELLTRALEQYYTLTEEPISISLVQEYDLNSMDSHLVEFIQLFSLLDDSSLPKVTTTVTINGNPILAVAADVEFNFQSYVGSCSLNLLSVAQWNTIDYLQEVQVTHNADVYSFIVTDLSKSETATNKTYSVQAMSKAVLLDYPYVDKIEDDDMVYGKASEIVSRIAAAHGQVVIWEMQSDPVQTSESYSVSGKSPLAAIRGLVNEIGGSLQSDPDGTLRANPWRKYNTDKMDEAPVSRAFQSSTDYTSINSDHSKRDGYNIFEVLNKDDNSGYSFETEEIASNHFIAKASKAPWDTEIPYVRTSELTNVTIEYLGVVSETITDELIELKAGTGTTDKFIQAIIGFDYDTRIDLGDITFTEEGVITTAVPAESMVTISYTMRYHKWDVKGSDSEKVQLILETA